MELVLIRHALPYRLEVDEGRADPGLDDVGKQQALRLAEWFAADRGGGVDAIYASPLRRAVETPAPLAEVCGRTVTVEADVAEWDRDAASYIPMEELKASGHELWQAMAAGRWDLLGIDVDAFRSRVVRSLDAIAAAHRGQRVAVVCHGGVINAYVGAALGLEPLLFFEPDYTSCSRLLIAGGTRSIRSLNETGHLHGA